MSITCSSCVIRGQRICLHLTAGEKWVLDNLERERVIKEQTKEWLFYNNLIREGSE